MPKHGPPGDPHGLKAKRKAKKASQGYAAAKKKLAGKVGY